MLFIIAQILSAWFSISPSQSFWGNLTAPDSVLSFIIYFLVFFLFSFYFRREDIKRLIFVAAIGFGITTIVVILKAFGVFFFPWQFARSASFDPFGSDAGWGIVAAAVIAALSVIRPGDLASRTKVFFWMVVGVVIIGLILLNYQSLWLALAIFVVVVAALRFEPREHFQYAFAIVVLALFFALVSGRLPALSQIPKDIRPGVSATLSTAQGVLTGHAFLVGSGPATFAFDFAALKPVSTNMTSFWSMSFPQGHDFAVTLLATSGLLGFLLFLIIVFLVIQPLLRIHSLDTEAAMIASAIAFITASLFLYPASFAELILLFSLLGIFTADHSRYAISLATLSPGKSFGVSIIALVLAAFSLAGVFFLGEQYVAAIFFQQSNDLAVAGNLQQAFAKVNAAYGMDHSDEYLRAASQILLSQARVLAISQDQNVLAELPAAVANAVQTAQSAVVLNQHDPANWGNLGSVYEAVMPVANGADQLAAASYQNAANLDPVNPQWDVDIARTIMESAALLPATTGNSATIQGDLNNAEVILQKAISLKDDYADPRALLVQLYLREGNMAQAIQKVQELQQQSPLDPGIAFELGDLYYNTNQLDQATQEFQLATLLSPNYANARYFLGLIDDQQGMAAQALTQFQEIQASNPGSAQVAQIIANIQAGRPALTGSSGLSTFSDQPGVAVLPNTSTSSKKGK